MITNSVTGSLPTNVSKPVGTSDANAFNQRAAIEKQNQESGSTISLEKTVSAQNAQIVNLLV